MIYIKRIAPPNIFEEKKKNIEKEILKAKAFFSGNYEGKKTDGLFRFYSAQKNAYKDILINMFRQRCAYCECLVTVGSRGDIEHFRPKGEFVKRDGTAGKPGYYWLAADWNNLYLSCTNCNQKTIFRIIDSKDPTKMIEKTVGKMNQFGLKDEAFRLKNETQKIEDEEQYRLLIDPCRDKPEELLEFTKDGIIKAREIDGKENEMASYSIDVYGLQRERLVGVRKQKYIDIMGKIVTVKRLTGLVIEGIKQQLSSEQHRFNSDEMEKIFLNLMEMLDADNIYSEYIGLARQHSQLFLDEYAKLLNATLDPDLHRDQPWYEQALAYFQPQLLALKSHFEKRR